MPLRPSCCEPGVIFGQFRIFWATVIFAPLRFTRTLLAIAEPGQLALSIVFKRTAFIRKRPTYGENRRPFYGVTTKVFELGSECSLCDLSVPCFRIADRVNPYLIKVRFYQ